MSAVNPATVRLLKLVSVSCFAAIADNTLLPETVRLLETSALPNTSRASCGLALRIPHALLLRTMTPVPAALPSIREPAVGALTRLVSNEAKARALETRAGQ